MLQRAKVVLGLVAFVLVIATVVDAASDPNQYVLQNTTTVFGALTPAGRGAVRLSAKDSHVYAAPFRGLGLLPETSLVPAYWRITPAMSNASALHWTFPSGANQSDLVMEGINATTPVPSTTGDTADLNLGPYRFLIEAFKGDKTPYKSAYLTINIQRGAANLGTFEPADWRLILGKGVTPSTWTGDTILLSTGMDRTDKQTTFNGLNFAKTVTFKHADPTRPGGILNLGFMGGSSNALVTGISFTGDLTKVNVLGGVVLFGAGSTNMAVRNCNATFNMTTAGSRPAVMFGGCINCEATDFFAFGVDTGVADNQLAQNINISVTRFRARQFYNNAIWVGNAKNLSFIDCTTIGPVRNNAYHIDHFQVADGASPQGLKVIRHQMYKAEGNGGSQGFFGGTAGIYYGYIDDNSTFGSYSSKPGNILTIKNVTSYMPITPWTWLRGAQFSQLIQTTSGSSTGALVGQYVINQTIKAPPGVIHSAPFTDLTINGLAYTGWNRDVLWIREGTYILSGTNFSYPQPIELRGSPDIPNKPNQGPACDFLGVDIPSMYSGQSNFSSLYMWWSENGVPAYRPMMKGPSIKPASINIDSASTVWNRANSTVAASCYAQGDPQFGPNGLQQLTNADWAKLSFDEVVARHVAALTPRVGGPLTSGSKDFGPFTRNGLWNDGSNKRPY